jgi:protein TonB
MKISFTFLLLLVFGFADAQADTIKSSGVDSAIYFNPEITASYPGGQSAWMRYLQKNLIYPQEAQKMDVQGTVVIKFMVDSNGLSHNAEVVNGPEELRSETIRIIEKVKLWNPGVYEGRKVNSWKIQPIGYRLETRTDRVTLLGNYHQGPITGYSDKPFEEVWKSILDYLSQNDMNIKKDSSKGLIISKKSKLSASYENENGVLFHPESDVVLQTEVTSNNFKPRRPDFMIMGDWYI